MIFNKNKNKKKEKEMEINVDIFKMYFIFQDDDYCVPEGCLNILFTILYVNTKHH